MRLKSGLLRLLHLRLKDLGDALVAELVQFFEAFQALLLLDDLIDLFLSLLRQAGKLEELGVFRNVIDCLHHCLQLLVEHLSASQLGCCLPGATEEIFIAKFR